ncbi:MAG: DUF1343 domain-containing protein [Verrucomicrobiae bacterium]|nr:DUF1343 domain-containing protein [Verrucomicrobiae bacterium]
MKLNLKDFSTKLIIHGMGGFLCLLLAGCLSTGGKSKVLPSSGQRAYPVKLGIDVLRESGYAPLQGKRVGLICNQTSVDRNGNRTREVLHRAPQVRLTALYTPEHGLDGTELAGKKLSSRRDPVTGLTAYSLYGDTRKPTAAMLAPIDVMLFDLQDIGSRSYTYISTMALAMEACAENGKEFIVLDRPNPMGGLRVEGPPLESKWKSFVGQIPVPYVHGMTTGELAGMIHGKHMIRAVPRLTVIRMEGWSRAMSWSQTGLRWIPTSPNIPKGTSPLYYAATGMLGGLYGVDIGIGTSGAFEFAAAEGVDSNEFTRYMNAKNFQGVRFTPYYSKKKPGFAGSQIFIDHSASADLIELDVTLIAELNRRNRTDLFRNTPASEMSLFHKVFGSDSLANDLKRGVSPKTVAAKWKGYCQGFRSERMRYLLY